MRDNSQDKTIERAYIQKFRFLIEDYELVKAKKHPKKVSKNLHWK